MTDPIVIIGTGLAGYMLAKEFRKIDTETPLVMLTSDDGAFYSKPLLSTALAYQRSAEMLRTSSAEEMADQLPATIYPFSLVTDIHSDQHALSFIDQNEQEQQLTYAKLIIAVGAKKLTPTIEGNAGNAIRSVNDLMEYADFRDWIETRRNLVIMGTGLVGCEFANDLLSANYSIQLIAPDHSPLAKFVPAPIGNVLADAFAKLGAKWSLERSITRIEGGEQQCEITLSDGATLEADGVFAAVGLRPNIVLAQQAGLQTQRGVVVDRLLQTSAPDIYAMGDCAEVNGEVRQYVAPIMQCARALAKTLSGSPTEVVYPCMPIVVKTPACPVVSYLPEHAVAGEWEYEGEGMDMRAYYRNESGEMIGFALVGNATKERMKISREVVL